MLTNPATLIAEDIHKKFGNTEVLKGISLTALQGSVIAMIGSSGSGKSTFLRCLNLLEIPDAGRVIIDGELIRMHYTKDKKYIPSDYKQVDKIRSKLGMVFQNFNLWSHMTILENIIEAPIHVLKVPKTKALEQARFLLNKVGIENKKDFYPNQLSGGQQQRAAIARALAMDPKVMLFDEPTSALDPELVNEVLKVMKQLAEEGRTMLIVTHEMNFAREVASEVIYLHNGRIEEQGPPKEVFNNPKSERCRQFLAKSLHNVLH
ncbi:MAG: ATP-binding cassette domain-containing protein [Alphaproteobacteria bacterium]|nr:ATP-binding cassette domain-containing protein [Alphaproteobacteria bacterium]